MSTVLLLDDDKVFRRLVQVTLEAALEKLREPGPGSG
jgi:hypothetical protein